MLEDMYKKPESKYDYLDSTELKVIADPIPLTQPPITLEQEKLLGEFYKANTHLFSDKTSVKPISKQSNLEGAWIQTFSGRKVYPLDPNPDSIVIQDIAHSLAHQCRFTGHTSSFYSIAQHCVLVSYLCDYKDQMYGLLHDGSEYALVDIPSPLKRSPEFAFYREIEKKVQRIIYDRFELFGEEPESVKRADQMLLATEARDLMSPLHSDWRSLQKPLPFKIEALAPADAEKLFLDRFNELFNVKK
jgi:5'-deoxynucleotidase YfbR-like HD superfamily hydrolase